MQNKSGYLWDECYFWHNPGFYNSQDPFQQPLPHLESSESKRRIHNLVHLSGLYDQLYQIKAREAKQEELEYFHSKEYVEKVKEMSKGEGGDTGDWATMATNGFNIATRAVGGCLNAADSVMENLCQNAYCLVRPPGHHSTKNQGMGFCIFNNIALTAFHLQKKWGLKRIAIIDYDVHHGNGTQEAFYDQDSVLFISIHQDRNYPPNSGFTTEVGTNSGTNYNINIPLPAGSGWPAYSLVFQDIIQPALQKFQPQIILVSSGFDASIVDPLGRMMLTSQHFGQMAQIIKEMAQKFCGGKCLFLHEGGYSEHYSPFCGIKVLETLSGIKTPIVDSYLTEFNFRLQNEILEENQKRVIDEVKGIVQKMATHQ